MTVFAHALVLNLHQPPFNLEHLLETNEWEAREILWALDRIPRFLWDYEDRGRVHLALSGTLLETLSNPAFQSRVYGTIDCGSLLWHLQNRRVIDILGGAYYHPVLPLIPAADRAEHLARWQGIARHLFWRDEFNGFWPPEMGFCMELIPLLKQFGYSYVLVDSEHIDPVTPMGWEEVRYRPHIARYGGDEIIVVVRDRELSDAQESGMDFGWFLHEVYERTKWCEFVPLITTCTDGENGGWFRNTNPKGNFWGVFYRELLERIDRDSPIRPMFIHEYLRDNPVVGEVHVRTGAWNTGWHHGRDFRQWTGSQEQQDALQRVAALSAAIHAVRRRLAGAGSHAAALEHDIEDAMWHLLRAETSCNFYWGEAWVGRCDDDLNAAAASLDRVSARIGS